MQFYGKKMLKINGEVRVPTAFPSVKKIPL